MLDHFLITVFLVFMCLGTYFVLRLAKLSEAWKTIWVYFLLFLIFLPLTRWFEFFLWKQCPDGSVDNFLILYSPILGAFFFFIAMRKMFKLFKKYIKD